MGIEVNDPTIQTGVNSQIDELDTNSTDTPYLDEYLFVSDIAQRSNKYAERVKEAYDSGSAQLQGEYGDNSLGDQMRAVASMIAGGLSTNVYVVSMGGFDTHVNQQRHVGEDLIGAHPTLLARLSRAISEFQFDMIRLGEADRVTGMTISEFGRRANENGSYGTDHGAASVQFVFGTSVNSAVFGEAPNFSDLNNNGDLRAQIDYRTVYMEMLTDWFGLSVDDARAVLQSDDLLPLNVLEEPASVHDQRGHAGSTQLLGARPNPFTTETTIDFSIDRSGPVVVEIHSLDGRRIATLVDRQLEAGSHSVRFTENVSPGSYLCTIRTSTGSDTRALTCVR